MIYKAEIMRCIKYFTLQYSLIMLLISFMPITQYPHIYFNGYAELLDVIYHNVFYRILLLAV